MDMPYLFCIYPNRSKTSRHTREPAELLGLGSLQNSTRTFHVTLSPKIYKGGHGPLQRDRTIPEGIQTTTQDAEYYAPVA